MKVHAFAVLIVGATTLMAAGQPPTRAREPVLILLHGRDQQTGTGEMVRREWFDAVDRALTRISARDRFPGERRRFFWYGDLLNDEKGCALQFGVEAFRAAGWQVWSAARTAFLQVAGQLPNGAQRQIVDYFLEDTARYLGNGKVACAVDDSLAQLWRQIPQGTPIVVAAHSMGSIVLYKNLMGQLKDNGHTVYLITMGSMIAQQDVQRSILGSLSAYPAPVPPSVVWWRNLVNQGDILAFPAEAAFETSVVAKRPKDIAINSDDRDRHRATKYLESEAMGRLVREAQCLASGAKGSCTG